MIYIPFPKVNCMLSMVAFSTIFGFYAYIIFVAPINQKMLKITPKGNSREENYARILFREFGPFS